MIDREKLKKVISELDLYWGSEQDEGMGRGLKESSAAAIKSLQKQILRIKTKEDVLKENLSLLLSAGEALELMATFWLGRNDFDSYKGAIEHALNFSKEDFIFHCTEKKLMSEYIRNGYKNRNQN